MMREWIVVLGGCALVACGGGAKGGPADAARADAAQADAAPDAAPPDAAPPDARPDATIVAGLHTFVVDHITLPIHSGDGSKYGLDLDGDDVADNAVGAILAAWSSAAGGAANPQPTMDDAIVRGRVIFLASVTATSLTTATGVPLQEYIGAKPVPAACVDPQQVSTCGQHLKGTGMFELASSSPPGEVMTGPITAGNYAGGPGTAILPLALFDSAPVFVHLIGARAVIPSVTDNGFTTGVLGGGIAQTEVDSVLLPAMRDGMNAQIAHDCTTTTPPGCGCAPSSRGATYVSLFDKSPANCTVSFDEVKSNDLIKTLLAPDVTIDGTPALSVGVGLSAVPATF